MKYNILIDKITNEMKDNQYKTADEFLDEVSCTPEIHVVLKQSSYIQNVVFCADTC